MKRWRLLEKKRNKSKRQEKMFSDMRLAGIERRLDMLIKWQCR